MIQRFLILIVFSLFTSLAYSVSADVEDISYQKYFPAVKKLIAAGNIHGPEILLRACDKAAGTGKSSAYREFQYLFGVICAWAEEDKSEISRKSREEI